MSTYSDYIKKIRNSTKTLAQVHVVDDYIDIKKDDVIKIKRKKPKIKLDLSLIDQTVLPELEDRTEEE